MFLLQTTNSKFHVDVYGYRDDWYVRLKTTSALGVGARKCLFNRKIVMHRNYDNIQNHIVDLDGYYSVRRSTRTVPMFRGRWNVIRLVISSLPKS